MKSPLELLMNLRSILKQDVSSAHKLGLRTRPRKQEEHTAKREKADALLGSDDPKKLS